MAASGKIHQEKQSKVLVLAILSAVPVIMVGNSMLIPVLPTIQSDLKISPLQVSLLITLFSIPAGIIIPLSGILSDRYGRKRVIAPSLLLYGAGGLLTGFAAIWGGRGLLADAHGTDHSRHWGGGDSTDRHGPGERFI